MPRYILIDNSSGFIWGDTADYAATAELSHTPDDGALEAARLLDENNGVYDRAYRFEHNAPRDDRTGYHVYRADVGGSEAVAVVQDGQDQETIEAVQRDCEFVGFVTCEREAT